MDDAWSDAAAALKLEPVNAAAQEMLRLVQEKGGKGK